VIARKLSVAGIGALSLTPGVAWACNGTGNGPGGSMGATGATGSTAATGSSGVKNASVRRFKLRHMRHAHAHTAARRG